MAVVNVVNFTAEPIPGEYVASTNTSNTTPKRLVKFYCSGTCTAATDFLVLSTYIPNTSAVEGATVTTATGLVSTATYAAGSVVTGTAGQTFFITGVVSLT